MLNYTELAYLNARIEGHYTNLLQLQVEYREWTKKKADTIVELASALEDLYNHEGKPINTICKDIVIKLDLLGCTEGAEAYVYESLDKKYKNITFVELGKLSHKGSVGNPSVTPIKTMNSDFKEIEDNWQSYSKQDKVKKFKEIDLMEKELTEQRHNLENMLKNEGINPRKAKSKKTIVSQDEPPEEMQGTSEFYFAVEKTRDWFFEAYKRYDKILKDVYIYKPQNPEQDHDLARNWNFTVNDTIIGEIIDPILFEYSQPAADRKWSLGNFGWIKTIRERIEGSKHGAGKKAEGFIVNIDGNLVYDAKGNPIKRGLTRERVGDNEKRTVLFAIKLIKAMKGLTMLDTWVEDVQGGYRRMRKHRLHDYFSEAAFGSNISGNEDYVYESETLN